MKLRMNNRDSRTRLHLSVQHVYGGEGGIRTLGTGVSPYNGLANRRIRPLCHLSGVRRYSLPRPRRVLLPLQLDTSTSPLSIGPSRSCRRLGCARTLGSNLGFSIAEKLLDSRRIATSCCWRVPKPSHAKRSPRVVPRPTRTLVVDHSAIMRRALRALLQGRDHWTACDEAV